VVRMRNVSMMRRFFVISGFVMLRSSLVVPCRVFVMLGCFPVMFRCLLRHL
jgi:hypothetical protein